MTTNTSLAKLLARKEKWEKIREAYHAKLKSDQIREWQEWLFVANRALARIAFDIRKHTKE